MLLRRPLILFLLVLFPGLAAAAGPLSVFVSVVPQETFVSRVGGDHVRVRAMVRPGQNPHAFEPTARQIAALAGAELYVRIGLGFEDAWMTRLRAANPGMRVLDAREGIALRPGGHGHDRGELDPHIWTSPRVVKIMGARIRNVLSELAPDHAADFAANYQSLAADLDALDAAIRDRLAGLQRRRFLVYHPAWGYFAQDYGLEQVVIEKEGKEPGARALAELIDQARRDGIRVVLVQPQINPASAERVAQAIDGRVAAIDPLAGDYFANMRRVAELIAEAGHP
ncbi:MAG: zinc ABC transporter substrate-binding protein [Thiocapsa sp.]|jgi:zinc transport system substrate-binding protein|nr:zinc ABC transporter substrate-binding protein [Thiocapsa sp.]MCG6896910.1 zinc ABC transporter substrate-binding protein [Thiocapsa sp.]MCG6985533.1 zinc ABC transporter substrate-binding protein [Thiocapsa sp.]